MEIGHNCQVLFKYKWKSPQEVPKQTARKALYTSAVPYTGHPQTEYWARQTLSHSIQPFFSASNTTLSSGACRKFETMAEKSCLHSSDSSTGLSTITHDVWKKMEFIILILLFQFISSKGNRQGQRSKNTCNTSSSNNRGCKSLYTYNYTAYQGLHLYSTHLKLTLMLNSYSD